MSFNLGQFRRDQIEATQYLTSLKGDSQENIIPEDLEVESSDSTAFIFLDKVFQPSTSLRHGKNYYLRFKIKRPTDGNSQVITLKLGNSQWIDEFVLPPAKAQVWSTFEVVLSPLSEHNQIIFSLERINADYLLRNQDDTYGRKMTIEVEQFAEINNIISRLNASTLSRIGVQAPSGTLMCINGEGIRVGPSGVYEINNGYKIKFLGFVLKQRLQKNGETDYDYFILDYQY